MKKISLIIIAFVCLAFVTNVRAQCSATDFTFFVKAPTDVPVEVRWAVEDYLGNTFDLTSFATYSTNNEYILPSPYSFPSLPLPTLPYVKAYCRVILEAKISGVSHYGASDWVAPDPVTGIFYCGPVKVTFL